MGMPQDKVGEKWGGVAGQPQQAVEITVFSNLRPYIIYT